MKRSLRFLIALVLLFSLLIPSAPAHAVSESHKNVLAEGNDYTAILYDSLNGLPTSEANAIAQTADGFIWLGGYSGFIRYDGSEFHRFDSSDGISSVFSLYVDDLDRIWIGTNENGVACYDHGKINIYGCVEGLKSNSIRSMTSDNEGNIIGFSGSSVGGTGNVGGLVGTLSGTSRVINCYSSFGTSIP